MPNVIAVGGGPDKATAIHALLRSRIVSTLATDVATARLILTNDTSPAQPPEIAEG